MEASSILYASLSLGIAGLLMGYILVFAHEKLAVPQDEKVKNLNDVLPQVNCGGCGFAGCSGYAEAIVKNNAPLNLCAPGGEETAKKIAILMGAPVPDIKRMSAYVRCKGDVTHSAEYKYEYHGILECTQVEAVFKGSKVCEYSCLGLGSCVRACLFGAMKMSAQMTVKVDPEKCTACGMCMKVCPRDVITLLPYDDKAFFQVTCFSQENALDTRKHCKVGCFGCGLCAKNCPAKAIAILNNLATIDYNKCINCGECEKICPSKAINHIQKKKHHFIS